jgi:hypothetical protein
MSSFAGNGLLVSPDWQIEDGLLRASDCTAPSFPEAAVDYGSVIPFKHRLLERASSNFRGARLRSWRSPSNSSATTTRTGWKKYPVGRGLGQRVPRHTSAAFVDFLGDIVASQPTRQAIHVIADNLSTHKTQAVRTFLLEHPNVRLHFTPTYSSWLNQVEPWFSKIERGLLARGICTSAL